MARIELSFYDKKYVIEYNRASVKEFILTKPKDEFEQIVLLIKCGLNMHHKKDMPSDDDIIGWVMALGDDVKPFAEALHNLIQGVLDTFQEDRKNLKWGKVEA